MLYQIKDIIFIFLQTLTSLKSGALKYIFMSGFVALLIFGGMIWLAWSLAGTASSYIAALTPWQWAHESAFFGFIVGVGVVIGFILIMKYILLIVLSPLLSYISEKVEKSLIADYAPGGFSIASSAARSVRINTRNMVKEVFVTILLLIAGLIPVLNFIAIPLLLLVQAYFAGFGIMDFYLERHLTFKQTLVEVYKHKYAAMTLGGIFMMLFAIPLLGVIIAPYLTTVTGTKYFLKIKTPI
jgi:CysZ protein